MKNCKILVFFLVGFLFCGSLLAKPPVKDKGKGEKGIRNITAGCSPGISQSFVDLNNVRAVVNTNGGMWTLGNAMYEVPKGGGASSLYAGGIWVAGVDVNGQMRVAARTFSTSSEDDYWPGPLASKGDNMANVTPEVCNAYDQLWKVDKDMVSKFIGWYNADEDTRAIEYQGYAVPVVLETWPGNGPDFGAENEEYDRYLAPYADVDGNGRYNVDGGDYPNYEFGATSACKFVPERRADSLNNASVTLYGDQTLWWVYNDKGNIHTQTNGAAIGMEIRGQAFAFSTNDELNNMTFYNYQLINRSTYTLNNAYFGVWVDADVGDASDDLVGCDVNRGLSFAYNSKTPDGSGGIDHYGANPPAVGIDFFEGPYQDESEADELSSWDGVNIVSPDCTWGYRDTVDSEGIVIGKVRVGPGDIFNGNINGLNFGDGIVDNERWGMRRFVYHKIGSSDQGDPSNTIDFYNYLQGIWRDGSAMTYGDEGFHSSSVTAEFMFPWTTDDCNWGTKGDDPAEFGLATDWRMTNAVDGRLIQAAGPFVLRPGATNYITIGVPWGRSYNNDPEESVTVMKKADDKCQKLFENCFRMIDGPNCPDMTIVEMDNKLVFHLSNSVLSNNYMEQYEEIDPFIDPTYPLEKRKYKFQGYQVFQLRDANVTVNDLQDTEFAKLVFQCDIEDGVKQLVNYEWDANAGANAYQVMVEGADAGIKHTFVVTTDMFATSGSSALVNYKKYYYIAIAYGYNCYKPYDQTSVDLLDGQKTPYLAGRKSPTGQIPKYTAVPQPSYLGQEGIETNCDYGDIPPMTALSGRGNANNPLDLSDETVAEIMSGNTATPWKADRRTYKKNGGPVSVRVIDPFSVPEGDFILKMEPDSVLTVANGGVLNQDVTVMGANVDLNGLILNTQWTLIANGTDTMKNTNWLRSPYEYVLPEYGISIDLFQVRYPVANVSSQNGLSRTNNGVISSSITFENPDQPWYEGMADIEGQIPFNWIRAGQYNITGYSDAPGDNDQYYEKVVAGTWAPAKYLSSDAYGPGASSMNGQMNYQLYRIPSIKFVITKDRRMWTRCVVLESCENTPGTTGSLYPNPISEGGALKFMLRESPSVNKDGTFATSMTMEASENPNDPNYISAHGMSWFPGYAIDQETGERLNIAFAEDSYLVGQNGRDMIWNPTSELLALDGKAYFGGKHFVYVFASGYTKNNVNGGERFPHYDEGRTLARLMKRGASESITAHIDRVRNIMLNAAWATVPLVEPKYQWTRYADMPDNDVTVKISIANPYHQNIGFYQSDAEDAVNNGYPYYEFSLDGLAARTHSNKVLSEQLDRINVVPNPYYAYNNYELTQLDNVVKITNLPSTCNVRIFNVNGTLIRNFSKASDQTWLDWDLTNKDDVPVASGMYIIHVEVPGVGEKILKWFGVLRPADLSNF